MSNRQRAMVDQAYLEYSEARMLLREKIVYCMIDELPDSGEKFVNDQNYIGLDKLMSNYRKYVKETPVS